MIRSMTAFGRADHSQGNKSVSIELRSVNHRYLEFFVRMPRTHMVLEEKIKSLIKSRLARGRVEVFVQLERTADDTPFEVDHQLARAYHDALSDLQHALRIARPVTVADVVRQDGVVKMAAAEEDPEGDWPLVQAALEQALETFVAMRENEGEALYGDFAKRLDRLDAFLDEIEAQAKALPNDLQEKFMARIQKLAGGATELDPARVAQEAAFLADKADITEEVTRAKSHIRQFRQIMDAQEPGGRTLNFLTQELHREFSTMGSKSADADLSHVVVAAKAEVEKIREQVQNVE